MAVPPHWGPCPHGTSRNGTGIVTSRRTASRRRTSVFPIPFPRVQSLSRLLFKDSGVKTPASWTWTLLAPHGVTGSPASSILSGASRPADHGGGTVRRRSRGGAGGAVAQAARGRPEGGAARVSARDPGELSAASPAVVARPGTRSSCTTSSRSRWVERRRRRIWPCVAARTTPAPPSRTTAGATSPARGRLTAWPLISRGRRRGFLIGRLLAANRPAV
jgi:hypothetical protein